MFNFFREGHAGGVRPRLPLCVVYVRGHVVRRVDRRGGHGHRGRTGCSSSHHVFRSVQTSQFSIKVSLLGSVQYVLVRFLLSGNRASAHGLVHGLFYRK